MDRECISSYFHGSDDNSSNQQYQMKGQFQMLQNSFPQQLPLKSSSRWFFRGSARGMVLPATWIPCMHRWGFTHLHGLVPGESRTGADPLSSGWGDLLQNPEMKIYGNSYILPKLNLFNQDISIVMLSKMRIFVISHSNVAIF